MDKNELQDIKELVNDIAKIEKKLASRDILGAAKDVLNLLKNEQFRKKLRKKIMLIAIKGLLIFVIIVSITGALFGIFNTVKDTIAKLFSEIGDFVTSAWVWITDDYWIDIDKGITITQEDGTEKTQTLVDHYMEQLETLGISLKDLRILGDADYSDSTVLENPENKEKIQKYLSEFVRADIISQEFHRQNRHDELINPNDDSEVDGGVYLYRTKNEVTEEGIVSVDDNTTFRMQFTEYQEFMNYQNNDEKDIDYDKAREMFTVDTTTKELLFYKVDQIFQGESEHIDHAYIDNRYNNKLTLQRVDYRNLISKYTMPFEFLVNLCMVTQNPEFVYHVAYLARNTNIELIILDSIQEEFYYEETQGHYHKYYGEDLIDEKIDSIKITEDNKRIDTPTLVVGTVNTWSYLGAYKYTNRIIDNPESGTQEIDLEDIYDTSTEDVDGEIVTYDEEWTDVKKKTTTSIKANEYSQAIALDETKKSKQFLGLLRNSIGTCNSENVETCVKNAVFDKNGINVSYKIPNSTREEMPLSKLQSGKEWLYSLLEINNSNLQLSSYNAKMQGLKEYMQYILTFPDNEWIDLTNQDLRDLLNSNTYDNVTYGMFWWPLDPNADVRISSFFGPRRAPTPTASTDHGAIDIAVVTGTDVLASADGVVEYAGYDEGGYGNYITIDHQNGFKTRYAHNSELLVKKGDTVTKGQVIAKSGSTGNSTGPHLHFEIHVNGTKVDPLDYVSMTNKQPMAETYPVTNAQQIDIIYAVVAQECATSYEGALAVITCVLNRCESLAWKNYGGNDPYKQITAPSQFAYSEAVDSEQHYKQYLNGKAPDYVKQAVDDALNKGIRNHNYTRFRTATEEYKKKYPNGQDIGGNWYF